MDIQKRLQRHDKPGLDFRYGIAVALRGRLQGKKIHSYSPVEDMDGFHAIKKTSFSSLIQPPQIISDAFIPFCKYCARRMKNQPSGKIYIILQYLPARNIEYLQLETLCASNHTACCFAEKTCFFRAPWAGALLRRLALFLFQRLNALALPERTGVMSFGKSRENPHATNILFRMVCVRQKGSTR